MGRGSFVTMVLTVDLDLAARMSGWPFHRRIPLLISSIVLGGDTESSLSRRPGPGVRDPRGVLHGQGATPDGGPGDHCSLLRHDEVDAGEVGLLEELPCGELVLLCI